MNEENTKKLFKKYPKMLSNLKYIDTKDGWFWLINRLCERIQTYIDDNQHLKTPQITVEQIKQKCFGLRFYYINGDEKINGMVWFAEYLSYFINEKTGEIKSVPTSTGFFSPSSGRK